MLVSHNSLLLSLQSFILLANLPRQVITPVITQLTGVLQCHASGFSRFKVFAEKKGVGIFMSYFKWKLHKSLLRSIKHVHMHVLRGLCNNKNNLWGIVWIEKSIHDEKLETCHHYQHAIINVTMTLAKQFTLKEKIMFWLMNRFLKTEMESTKRYQWSSIEKPLRDYDLLSLEPRECENIMVTPRSIILRSPFAFSSRLCLFSAVSFGFEKKKNLETNKWLLPVILP